MFWKLMPMFVFFHRVFFEKSCRAFFEKFGIFFYPPLSFQNGGREESLRYLLGICLFIQRNLLPCAVYQFAGMGKPGLFQQREGSIAAVVYQIRIVAI